MIKPIKKLMIVNRGEVADRIITAAKKLNIATLVVYVDVDRNLSYLDRADEIVELSYDKNPSQAFLDISQLLMIAKQFHVDAIHPGYGYLSENSEFAQEVVDEGLIFVGPTAEHLSLFGNKYRARKIALDAGVPIINGTSYRKENIDQINFGVGFPLLVKSLSGGGGRGMRVANNPEELEQAVSVVSKESLAAFGQDNIYVEQFLPNAKHIEIQILADHYGQTVHLFERDGSIQRRFQKIVEFAPSISIETSLLEKMYADAIKIASSVHYENLLTVEFLVRDGKYFFLEANPRLQVEHTVTEVVTSVDLVSAQIQVAQGKTLRELHLMQNNIRLNGVSIEARIVAEDPENNFMPSIGLITKWEFPQQRYLRVDQMGAMSGYTITPYFDSLLAKTISIGDSLQQASERLIAYLKQTNVSGVKTDTEFLFNILSSRIFQSGEAIVN